MIDTIEITEILARADEGMTRPFFCGGSDGKQYYVKGNEALRNGLRSEMLAAQIAIDFNLPIPNFKLGYVDEMLIRDSIFKNKQELGCGYVWCSEYVPLTNIFCSLFSNDVPDYLKDKILLYDWFIKNDDRSDNNPNILWNMENKSIHIIDHNLAFDSGFNISHFWQKHVFRKKPNEIFTDEFQDEYSPLLKLCISKLDTYMSEFPSDWTNGSNDFTLYKNCVSEKINHVLNNTVNFWHGEL